jgi:Cu/Ag efflux protein CusF
MRLWRVIVLMLVTLAVGIGLGYVRWAREARELREALALAQETRPQQAAAQGPWIARGVVRIVLPGQGILFLTHEAIPGLMPGATRAFAVASAPLFSGLTPGDSVRFTLERRGQRVVLVAIERDGGA